MVPAVGDSDLNQPPGQLPVATRPGLVVAARQPDRGPRPGLSLSDYLPFVITLLAGGIVVAVVALAMGGPARRPAAIPLPPPSVSAAPAASIGAAGHHRAGR